MGWKIRRRLNCKQCHLWPMIQGSPLKQSLSLFLASVNDDTGGSLFWSPPYSTGTVISVRWFFLILWFLMHHLFTKIANNLTHLRLRYKSDNIVWLCLRVAFSKNVFLFLHRSPNLLWHILHPILSISFNSLSRI